MNHPYQVMGTSIPKLIGRCGLVEKLAGHLLKPAPDHVQVVGPTLFGKSVFLNGLAQQYGEGNSYFATAKYVDLRHAAPADDSAFMKMFAEVVREALAGIGHNLADQIDPEDSRPLELLETVFQLMEPEEQVTRILVVLDGFDHVLAGAQFTKNLWDNLLSVAKQSSLRLVTGSLLPLLDLCKSEDARTSHFWEIFNPNPVVVGPFVDGDWQDLLDPLGPRPGGPTQQCSSLQ